jgi:hypothetical protein
MSSQIESVDSAIQQLDAEKEILEKQLKNATDKMNRLSKQQKKREKEAEVTRFLRFIFYFFSFSSAIWTRRLPSITEPRQSWNRTKTGPKMRAK